MNEVRTRTRLKSSGAAPARGNGRLHKSEAVPAWAEGSRDTQMRQILAAMEAFRDGNFNVRLPKHWSTTNARLAAAGSPVPPSENISLDESLHATGPRTLIQ